MESKPEVSIYAYNGMKVCLVRALKELYRVKGIDRSYTNLAQFVMDHLEIKEDQPFISQPIPEMPPNDKTKAHTESLREIFFDNMLDNCIDDDVGFGNRLRDDVYDIAELVKINSFKTYELIKDIFCFLSEMSLDEMYSIYYKEKTSFITDINLVHEIISQNKNELS